MGAVVLECIDGSTPDTEAWAVEANRGPRARAHPDAACAGGGRAPDSGRIRLRCSPNHVDGNEPAADGRRRPDHDARADVGATGGTGPPRHGGDDGEQGRRTGDRAGRSALHRQPGSHVRIGDTELRLRSSEPPQLPRHRVGLQPGSHRRQPAVRPQLPRRAHGGGPARRGRVLGQGVRRGPPARSHRHLRGLRRPARPVGVLPPCRHHRGGRLVIAPRPRRSPCSGLRLVHAQPDRRRARRQRRAG